MSEPEGFLERWSRRKRESADPPTAAQAAAPAPNAPATGDGPAPAGARASDDAEAISVDLSKLPSLDDITATTDIRAFLAPGVPPELTRAALRRAWVTDPAIRDFVGLQEYDWDFNNPAGRHGFGELPADLDVKKLAARILGESDIEAAKKTDETPRSDSEAGPPASQVEPERVIEEQGQDITEAFVHRDNNTAMHKSIPAEKAGAPKVRRLHGGALPE
jgi:hypothetical protein